MMRVLLFNLIASCLLIFGCKKTEAIPPLDNKTYNVSFTVSNISKKTDVPTFAEDTMKNFTYYIYNSEGYRVQSSDKQVLKSGTSIILNENLPQGKYKYVFFTSDQPLNSHIADSPGEVSSFVYAGFHDIYHKTVEITVGTDKLNQVVILDRLNSSLEIDLLDEDIPANIARIEVIWTDNKYIGFDGASFTTSRKQKNLTFVPGDNTRKLEKVLTGIFNTSSPFTVYINYMDIEGRYISGKQINNVRCYKNEKTTLSGYLFNPVIAEFKTTTGPLGESPARSAAL